MNTSISTDDRIKFLRIYIIYLYIYLIIFLIGIIGNIFNLIVFFSKEISFKSMFNLFYSLFNK